MDYRYPLVADTITAEDNKAKADWLMTNPRLTMGELINYYQTKWSDYINRKYSIACNSGSSANHLMYEALLESGRLKNRKVIVPSAAWVTTISPAMKLGFEPIMCEADYFNFGLDTHHLEQLLREHNPSIVMLVQVLGVPAHMDQIMELKAKYKFILLEDACAAMGSSYRGRKVGTFGDMSSISTYFGHQFSTVEGGMVSTDDEELSEIVSMLRSHGWINNLSPDAKARYLNRHNIKDIGTGFVFEFPGNNFRLSDDNAFYGIRQLTRMNWLVERRYANHIIYKKLLKNHFGFQIFNEADTVVCSIHFCALARDEDERNFITSYLENNGIETRPFTSGNQGLQPYWFKKYGKFNSPMATNLYKCGFFLPNYPALQPKDIEIISATAIQGALEFRKEQKT